MRLYDVVWGKTDIQDKQVIKIIKHPAVQRIKKIWISAYGYLFDLKRNATRFDHSVGVYLLLKNFGASKEEQIAGLLHDVSHTALSHVSTYAMLGKFTGKEFHEMHHDRFIRQSGLSDMLHRMGYDTNILLDENRHPLLENSLPDICADRLDYAIRDGLHLQTLSRQQANEIIKGLKVVDNEFAFNNENAAFTYSFNFYLLNMMYYGSAVEAHFNNNFGNMVKYAVKKAVLSENDWFSDDVTIIGKLRKSKNKKVQDWINKFNNRLVVFEDSENPNNILPKKIRIVDPKIIIGKKIKRLSQVSKVYRSIIDNYKRLHSKHELSIKEFYKTY